MSFFLRIIFLSSQVMTAVTGFSGSSLRDECLCAATIAGRQPAAAEAAAVAAVAAVAADAADAIATATAPPSHAGRHTTTAAVHTHDQQHFVVHPAAAVGDNATIAPQRSVSFQRSISAGSIPAGGRAARRSANGHHQPAVMAADAAGVASTCQCRAGVARANGAAIAITMPPLMRPTPQRFARLPGLLRRLQLWRWRLQHFRHGKRAAGRGGFYSPPVESARSSAAGLQSLFATEIHPPVIRKSGELTADTMVSVPDSPPPTVHEIEICRTTDRSATNESDGSSDELTVYMNELRLREQS